MSDRSERDGDVLRPHPATASSDTLVRLVSAVDRMPAPVFATVDGGHFDDLPAMLAAAGLPARSLFLGHGERDVERHGPWFVPLVRPDDAKAVLGLVGNLPAVVFWSCPTGDVALYGHLRRLNMARIPVWAAAGKDGPEPGVDADRGYEAVLFRHWDPSVLGALLPVLDEAQFSRIMGPAQEVAFHAEDHGGTRRVVADPDWPIAPAGMLTIRDDQVRALTDRLAAVRRRRLASYMREVTGRELDGVPDAELHQHVLASEASANSLGTETEAGQCRWTHLMYATSGEAARRPEVTGFIQSGVKTPDAQLEAIMGESIQHLKRTQAQPRPRVAS